MKAWHRQRRVGPQTEREGQLSRAKKCAGSAPQWPNSLSTLPDGSLSCLLRKRATASPFTLASCYSWSSNEHTSTTVWQKSRSVPHFLQPPAINKEPESDEKIYVNQRREEMVRTWKHILRHDDFRAKYRYVGVCFFQPLSVGGFFSNQRESISRCPRGPYPSKTQNRQIARTSPLTAFAHPWLP